MAAMAAMGCDVCEACFVMDDGAATPHGWSILVAIRGCPEVGAECSMQQNAWLECVDAAVDKGLEGKGMLDAQNCRLREHCRQAGRYIACMVGENMGSIQHIEAAGSLSSGGSGMMSVERSNNMAFRRELD